MGPINLTVMPLNTADARRLADCNAPDRGIVVITIRPDTRRIGWIARDVLTAVGVRHDVSGRVRSDSDDYQLAATWLDAHDVTDLIVVGIEMLPAELLPELIDLTTLAGSALWLVADHRLPATTTELLTDWPTATLGPVPFASRWLSPTTEPEPEPANAPLPDDSGLPAAVPYADVAVFRASCRQLLEADEFAAVDERYLAAFDAADSALGAEADLCEVVRDAVLACRSCVETTVTVRAVQAAAFRRGTYLKIDLPTLLAHDDHVRAAAAGDPASWRSLRAYRHPHRQSICALTLLGASPTQLQATSVADLADDTTTLTINGRELPIPCAARPVLRALKTTRMAVAAADDEPLVADLAGSPVSERAMANVIGRVPAELGFRLDVGQIHRTPPAAHVWANRRGIRITELEG